LENFIPKATAKSDERLTNETNVENKEHLKVLIEGCLKNDRRSQEKLFKLYYGKMLGVCMRYSTIEIQQRKFSKKVSLRSLKN